MDILGQSLHWWRCVVVSALTGIFESLPSRREPTGCQLFINYSFPPMFLHLEEENKKRKNEQRGSLLVFPLLVPPLISFYLEAGVAI